MALLFLSPLATVAQDEAPDLTTRPSQNGEPTEVRIETILIDLQDVTGTNQSFTANFAYAARWHDNRLKHEGPGTITVPIDEIWHPRLQIVNRQSIQETFPAEAQVSPDGNVTLVQRVWGQFTQPLSLKDFPFDQQTLQISLVGTGHESGTVKFVNDTEFPSRVNEELSISDWIILDWNTEPFERTLARADHTVPGFHLSINVDRISSYHLVSIILPLIMIICMSWVVFWLDPKTAAPRVSVAVTAMLTLIAYRFAVSASLPKIAYLTRMDWFVLGSSILVFVSLLEVVVTSYLASEDRIDDAKKINRRMRVIAPTAFVLITVFSLVI
ncbi:MAG: hypothetical protein AAF591_03140 [Verrucomicrobiota bacterium]